MFEISVALKYLLPRWRQLSVSIISLVSTLVIALVVWLIVVFFSVKDGLENSWVDKIVALTAPVRVTPTEQYYNSYYYLVDSISAQTNYTSKSIGEKLTSELTDPYDPYSDEEPPKHWLTADRDGDGHVKDLAKAVFQKASNLSGLQHLTVNDFETTFANLRLRLLRNHPSQAQQTQQFMEHATYIGSFDSDNPALVNALYPPTPADLQNLLMMQSVSSDNINEDSPSTVNQMEQSALHERIKNYFITFKIDALKTPSLGWRIPASMLPEEARFTAAAILKDAHVYRLIIPAYAKDLDHLLKSLQETGLSVVPAEVVINHGKNLVAIPGKEIQQLSPATWLMLQGGTTLSASIIEESVGFASKPQNIRFNVHAEIQKIPLKGKIALGKLEIAEAKIRGDGESTLLAHASPNGRGIILPQETFSGDPILLPRNFREAGALIGDQGYLSYYSPTPSAVQEQRIPVYVAGFYDPGIMPIGGKYLLASKELTSLIRSSYNQDDVLVSNGFNIRFSNLSEAPRVKTELLRAFQEDGTAPYWHVETYQEYEFTKDLIQQLHSEKNLFSLISLIIIIVACSNIISMLIILVNDKKLEIGILRSMGASSASIAAIFGFCGMVMGALGSLIGISAAIITLRYVNELVGFISKIQGYDLFNPVFYGNTLPTELSFEALTFVILTTAFISLLAGVVPAVKASMLRPSAILRAE